MTDALFLVWQMTALLSCVVAGGAMLFFFFRYPRTRAHPGPVLLCIFLCTCITNIMRVGLQVMHSNEGPLSSSDGSGSNSHLHTPPVTLSDVANAELLGHREGNPLEYIPFFFWCAFFFLTSATMWFLMLALDLIFSLSNPFLPFNADNLKHHIFAWPASLLYCIGFRYVLVSVDGHPSNHIRVFFHLPAYIVLIYISCQLTFAWRKSRRLEAHAHRTTRRMAKLILPYLAVFAIYTIASFVLYLVQVYHHRESTTANAVDQLTLVLETLAIFVLFCRDAGVFKALRDSSSGATTKLPMHQSELDDDDEEHGEELDVSNNLRRDIMKYTSMGIIKSIQSAMQCPNDHQEIAFDDYSRVESSVVIVHGELESVVLSFRDCAPKVFQSIRHHFHIDPNELLQSFDLGRILSEHGSEGKSGNIFYFTANKHYMVKSVPKEEYDTLRAILPHYHRYLLSHPQSMLCRYFGCYSISLPVGKRRMYFVVMQNLFHEGPVHQRFDLKGNCDQRQAISANQVESHIQLARQLRVIPTLMMDIDFRKLCGGMSLSPSATEAVQGQLCDDIVFLASRGIIDYSVLLGVRHLNSGERLPTFGGPSTGIHSENTDNVYYLGIIDMLQRYNWRWTLQRWVLGLLCKDTQDVSAVPPELYGSRLEEFVRSRLFDIQGAPEPRSSSRSRQSAGSARRPVRMSGDPQTPSASVGGRSAHSPYLSNPEMVLSLEMDEFRPSTLVPDVPLSPSMSLDSNSFVHSSSSPSGAYSSVCQSPLSRSSSKRLTAPPSDAPRLSAKPAFFI